MATSKTKTAGEKKTATGKTSTTAKKPATKVTAKTTAKAPAAKKPAAPKAAAKKPAAPRAKKGALSPEQRYKMIQEAAYFMAEKDAFCGCAVDYWIAAEAQIELMLRGD